MEPPRDTTTTSTASTTTYQSRLAAEIRAALARDKRSTADLATALGVSQTTARSRLEGTRPFTVGELALVADMLGISAAALMQRAEGSDNEARSA